MADPDEKGVERLMLVLCHVLLDIPFTALVSLEL